MKKIFFTGGGTAGHVSPNIAIIQKLKILYSPEELKLAYIGGRKGIEKELIMAENIAFHGISCGKLRRYKSLKNLTDAFRVLAGIWQSFWILRKEKPDLLFSKGGFVAVPPVLAAALLKIPILIHESDYSPGLTTKISARFAEKICLTFADTAQFLPGKKVAVTGTPIRQHLHKGSAEAGYALTGFCKDLPVILVMGGSQGSQAINQALYSALPELTKNYQIIHLVGRGNLANLPEHPNYKAFEFLTKELADVFAISQYVISRAGSNAIFEFLSLQKPMLLIPLPLSASRGDQILNADYFQKMGYALRLNQADLTAESLVGAVAELIARKDKILHQMRDCEQGVDAVLAEIENYLA